MEQESTFLEPGFDFVSRLILISTMLRKRMIVFISWGLVILVLAPNWVRASQSCADHPPHSSVLKSEKTSPVQSQDCHECHCPPHVGGCHGTNLFISVGCRIPLLASMTENSYLIGNSLALNEPILEGPFQPPRAA